MAEEVKFEPVNLWAKVKARCLGDNPGIKKDEEGRRIVMCPRCEKWFRAEELTVLSIMPAMRQWCSPVIKCSSCSHLWSYCE